MSSKVLLLLGLLLAIGLVISSEVAAKKNLVDVSTSTEKKDDVATGTTAQNTETVGEYSTVGGVGGGGGAADSYGGRCKYGCCSWRGGAYGCSRCCHYAGQAVDADQTQAKPGN